MRKCDCVAVGAVLLLDLALLLLLGGNVYSILTAFLSGKETFITRGFLIMCLTMVVTCIIFCARACWLLFRQQFRAAMAFQRLCCFTWLGYLLVFFTLLSFPIPPVGNSNYLNVYSFLSVLIAVPFAVTPWLIAWVLAAGKSA